MKILRSALAALALLAFGQAAVAQTLVVDTCGVLTARWVVGSTGRPLLIDRDGNLCAGGGVKTTARLLSAAASTNGTSAKATPGRIYGIQGYNAASAVRYLKIYNLAVAPTVGTTVPVKTLALPPAAGFAFDFPGGYYLSAGIGYGLTTGSADNDTGALTAADVVGLNIDYN